MVPTMIYQYLSLVVIIFLSFSFIIASLTQEINVILNTYIKVLCEAEFYARSLAFLLYPEISSLRNAQLELLHLLDGKSPCSSFHFLDENDFIQIYGDNIYDVINVDISDGLIVRQEKACQIANKSLASLYDILVSTKDPAQITTAISGNNGDNILSNSFFFVPIIDHDKVVMKPGNKFQIDDTYNSLLFNYVDNNCDDINHILKSNDFCNIELVKSSGRSRTFQGIRLADRSVWFIKSDHILSSPQHSFQKPENGQYFCSMRIEVTASKIMRLFSSRVLPLGLVWLKLPEPALKDGVLAIIQPYLANVNESVIVKDCGILSIPTWDNFATNEERGLLLAHHVLDLWLGNTDGHAGNCLISADGHFIPIDFGQTLELYKNDDVIDYLNGYRRMPTVAVGKFILLAASKGELDIPNSVFLAMRNMIIRIQSLINQDTLQNAFDSIPNDCFIEVTQIGKDEAVQKMLYLKNELMVVWEHILGQYFPGFKWPLRAAKQIVKERCDRLVWPLPQCIFIPENGKIHGQWNIKTAIKRDISQYYWANELYNIQDHQLIFYDQQTFATEKDCWIYFEAISADIASFK